MNNNTVNGTRGVRGIWRTILWGALALILVIPALAMQVTPEVDWSAADFIIMGMLLAVVGVAIEVAMRFVQSWPARLMATAAVLMVFLAVWVELAVGVFGTPFAGS